MGQYKVIHVTHPSFGGEIVPLIVKAKRLNPKKLGKTLKLTNKELGMNLMKLPQIHGGWILPALTIATQLPGIINGFKSLFGRGITMGGIAAYQPPYEDLFNDSLYTRCSECGTRIFNGKTPASGGNIFGDIMDGVSRVADIAAKIVPLFGRGLISKKSDFNSGGRLFNGSYGGRIKLALGEGMPGDATSCSIPTDSGKKLLVFPIIEK